MMPNSKTYTWWEYARIAISSGTLNKKLLLSKLEEGLFMALSDSWQKITRWGFNKNCKMYNRFLPVSGSRSGH